MRVLVWCVCVCVYTSDTSSGDEGMLYFLFVMGGAGLTPTPSGLLVLNGERDGLQDYMDSDNS